MKKIYLVPHTHFDAEVFLTREEYLEWGFSNILEAMRLLRKYPEFRFTIDQVCYAEPFMQRYPECREEFLQLIKEGRLYVAGGMYAQSDMNMPSGESLARQFLRGVNYCRDVLGADVSVGWTVDSFGYSPQTPQIMKKAGFKYHAFGRPSGVAAVTVSDYIWEAPDGSEMMCHHMPLGYALPIPDTQVKFNEAIFAGLEVFEKYSAFDSYLYVSGPDLGAPDAQTVEFVHRFNETHPDIEIIIATPLDYFTAMEEHRGSLKRIKADLNPIFQGCYTSRIESKLGNRRLEKELVTAETLAACAGSSLDAEELQRAWDRVLFNQFHDDLCGCTVDKVFKLIMERYAASEETAAIIKQAALEQLGELVDTTGEGIPIIVFNPLGWQRREPVRAKFTVPDPDGILGFEVRNSAGTVLLSSVIESENYKDGGFKQVTILFIAELPSMGYEVFRIVPLYDESANNKDKMKFNIPTDWQTWDMGNEFFEVKVDYITGVISSLQLKDSGSQLIDEDRPWGGMVTKEPDNGDFWELNSPLRGCVRHNRSVMESPGAMYTKDGGGSVYCDKKDIRATTFVEQNLGKNTIRYQMTVYSQINRIDVEGTIINTEQDMHYRTAFPLNVNGTALRGIPFGYCDTPEGEYPAVDFMDISDEEKGITVLNTGNAGNCYMDNIYTLSLLRATSYKSYAGGGYSSETPADGGFEIGKKIPFKFAIVPHSGKGAPAECAKAAREFNVPSEVWKCSAHGGSMPKRFSFVETDCPTAIITCFKSSEKGYVLRFYEAGGVSYDDAAITVNMDVSKAVEVDFIENPISGEVIELADKKLRFSLKANEVKTFVLY